MKNNKMKLTIIVAHDLNRVIGYKGKIPWKLPTDLKHFKEVTTGYPVIMGRKTFESIGSKPLPGRDNVVLSRTYLDSECGFRNSNSIVQAVSKFNNLESCLSGLSEIFDRAFIIGGEQIYQQAMPYVDEIIASEIGDIFLGDSYFPEVDRDQFKKTQSTYVGIDSHIYRIVKYIRRSE